MNAAPRGPRERALAIGRLLRLSLFPTAYADPLVGLLLAGGADAFDGSVLWLLAGSLCVYHGAMALNDWADREHDARTRPIRPIPSGAVSPGAALTIALAGLVLGPLLAAMVAPLAGLILAAASAMAAVYDLAGRGPWRGPLLLAACRFANVSAGIAAGLHVSGFTFRPLALLPPLAYAAYVFFVSRLGRLEDDLESEPGTRPVPLLRGAAACLLACAIAALIYSLNRSLTEAGFLILFGLPGLVLAVFAAADIASVSRSQDTFTREDVERAMGVCLRRLLVCQAAISLCIATGTGFLVSLVILLGYPAASSLRRVFPPS